MKSFGLRQQPCGVLALTESSADTRPPIFTTCGFCQEIQNPVADGSRDSLVCQLHDQSAWAYCVKRRVVVQKELPGIHFAALQVL